MKYLRTVLFSLLFALLAYLQVAWLIIVLAVVIILSSLAAMAKPDLIDRHLISTLPFLFFDLASDCGAVAACIWFGLTDAAALLALGALVNFTAQSMSISRRRGM